MLVSPNPTKASTDPRGVRQRHGDQGVDHQPPSYMTFDALQVAACLNPGVCKNEGDERSAESGGGRGHRRRGGPVRVRGQEADVSYMVLHATPGMGRTQAQGAIGARHASGACKESQLWPAITRGIKPIFHRSMHSERRHL